MKLFLLLAFVSLENSVLAIPDREERDADQNSCDHPDCFLYATKLVAGIDWSTNPCDDFFQFTCGRWIKKVDNPTMKTKVDTLSLQEDNLFRRVRDILRFPGDDNEIALKKAQKMYTSCTDARDNVDTNINHLKDIVNQIGGWKLGSSETVQMMDAVMLIANFASITDISVPFKVSAEIYDSKQLKQRLAFVLMKQPQKRDLLTRSSSSLTAEDIVTISSHVFGVDDEDQAMQDAKDVLQLDSIFQQFVDNDSSQKFCPLDTPDLKTEIDLVNFLNDIFRKVKTFTPNDTMAVDTTYFQKLFSFIKKPENAKSVYNYLMLYETIKYLRLIGDFLPSPMGEIRALTTRSQISRSDECVTPVMNCFDIAIARKYGELHHQIDKEIEVIKELTDDIIKQFSIRLGQLDWLDETSKQEALKKLKNLNPYYEYPKWAMDLDQVNKHYETITAEGSWIRDTYQCSRLSRHYNLAVITEPPRGHVKWEVSPLVTNAFYNPTKNEIHILEAILEDPTFNVNRLRLMNYAGLGSILGHEVTHGFDTKGVRYDETGFNRPWLTEESKAKFQERTQCLIDQYSSYKLTEKDLPGPVTEYQVNGHSTLGENIADDGGLKLSYFSYHEWMKRNKPEILPDILKKNFTEEQAFFLSFARQWCLKYEYGVSKGELNQVHTPNKWRINGPLSNFDKFAEAYNCPSSSPMVRGEKACHVW